MEFIALDNQPFSVVDDVGFRRPVEHLEPQYTLSSRHYFSDIVLPELHSIVEMHIHKLLAMGVTAISFTTDIWTSNVSPMNMLSLTAQWVDKDFVLRKAILHAQECAGSHTASAMSMAFEKMFETWKIPKNKVHAVLRDNARNMTKALEECRVASLPGMAHMLELAVNKDVLAQRSISETVATGKKIVGYVKLSQLAYSHLQAIQAAWSENRKA